MKLLLPIVTPVGDEVAASLGQAGIASFPGYTNRMVWVGKDLKDHLVTYSRPHLVLLAETI